MRRKGRIIDLMRTVPAGEDATFLCSTNAMPLPGMPRRGPLGRVIILHRGHALVRRVVAVDPFTKKTKVAVGHQLSRAVHARCLIRFKPGTVDVLLRPTVRGFQGIRYGWLSKGGRSAPARDRRLRTMEPRGAGNRPGLPRQRKADEYREGSSDEKR
jgi:hypothetical protein